MNYQNSYYPYWQNVQVLKGFFSKPLTLVCAIFAGLSFVFGSVNASSAYPTFGGSVSVLICIALLFFFIKSRSNDAMPFGGTVTLIQIYAVLEIIASGIMLLGLAGVTAATIFFLQEALKYLLIFEVFIVPLILTVLLNGIGMLLWANSIKRGSSSVYLSSRGSILLAVTSILMVVIGAVTIAAVYLYISKFGFEISSLINQFADTYGLADFQNNLHIPQNTVPSAAVMTVVINSVVSDIYYILIAALAISFHIYIKKHTKGLNLGEGQPVESNAEQYVAPVAPVSEEVPMANVVQQPVDFQPQSVNFGSMGNNNGTDNQSAMFENPYMQAVADDNSDSVGAVTCPNCHAECNNDMKFCSNCGTKLK